MARYLVGGYSADMGGTAQGVTVAHDGPGGGLVEDGLAVEMDSPSFLAQHPRLPVVYAVGEGDRTFRAFRVEGDADAAGEAAAAIELTPLGGPWAAGDAACHILIDPEGRFAVVSCWGSGESFVYRLDDDGAILSRSLAQAAVDPYAGVPESEMVAPRPDYAPRVSHAHFAEPLPGGRVITIDLGYDLARIWSYDVQHGELVLDGEVTFPYGVGPRHIAAHPSGSLFVIAEYAVQIYGLHPDTEGGYVIDSVTPVRTVARQPDEYAAHLSLSDDATRLYATVRRSDVLAVLEVSPDGTSARPLSESPSGAAWPRHHLVDGHRLHVANQNGGEITTFALDASGAPAGIVGRMPTPNPTVVLRLRAND